MDYTAIKECPVGYSKIGGKPDLPPDFEWFYYNGKIHDNGVNGHPLSFLAQINCEEAHKYDKDALLPSKGMLYFFYELDSLAWGYDPKSKGSARVYYHPGSVSELQRTDFPSDLPTGYQLPEIPIAFSDAKDLPSFEEFCEWHDKDDYGWEERYKYEDAKVKMGFDSELDDDIEEEPITKLLGYADIVQNSMLLQCEQVTNGIYWGEAVDVPETILSQDKKNCKKWRLLFQLDSIFIDDYEIMMWGDMGRLFFYIKIDDLKAENFENCWLILQCG